MSATTWSTISKAPRRWACTRSGSITSAVPGPAACLPRPPSTAWTSCPRWWHSWPQGRACLLADLPVAPPGPWALPSPVGHAGLDDVDAPTAGQKLFHLPGQLLAQQLLRRSEEHTSELQSRGHLV